MTSDRSSCDPSSLERVIRGDEDSAAFRRAAAHIEQCTRCQERLSQLAGADALWSETAAALKVGPPGHVESDEAPNTDFVQSADPHLLQLSILSKSSHPETLGRIGRYEVQRVLGRGGMGIVLQAHDMELNRPVALKVLLPHLASHGPARHRFAREARAAAAIMHEHVVAIHDVVPDDACPYLVMQYVPGESLQERVDRAGPLSLKEILRIGMQTASGLGAAHAQGVIHRDIKPSNILLENDVDRALLTDFGLARAVDDATVTRTGVIAGTPHFMSPEQAAGRDITVQSDLFSLGATLYFAATGRPPFRADSPLAVLRRIADDPHRPAWKVNSDIPIELSDLIDRLLAKKLRHRPSSAEETAALLGALLAQAQTPGLRPRGTKRWRATVTRLALFCGVFSGLIFLASPESEQPPSPSSKPPGPASPGAGEPTQSIVRRALDSGFSPPSEFWDSIDRANADLETLENSLNSGEPTQF